MNKSNQPPVVRRSRPSMRVVRLHAAHDLRLETAPTPRRPQADEVLLSIRAVGLCGSDLHLYQTGTIGSLPVAQPFVPGHEFMGVVLTAGARARDALGEPLLAGTRVAVDPHVACGRCEFCERGDPNLCPHHTFFGLPSADGALAEQLLVPARQCYPMPASLSDGAGALLETLGVALHAVDLARTAVGRTVIVAGCGPVGLLIVRLAHLAGAGRLIAVDPLAERTALARRWGATDTITGKIETVLPRLRKITGSRGADTVFEAAWAGPAVPACLSAAGPGAKVVLVGIPADDDCRFIHSEARRKGLTLIFSRRMKHTLTRAIQLAGGRSPQIALDELISHRWTLGASARAFSRNARYADEVIKSIIQPFR
jgi:L-iditol 2-dehydrogenase